MRTDIVKTAPGTATAGPRLRSRRLAAGWAAVAAWVFAVGAFAAEGPPRVTVIAAPVKISYRTFPIGRLPPEIVSATKDELGLCQALTRHTCQGRVTYKPAGPKTVTATVNGIEITLGMDIVIWLGEGTDAHVREHEETHREIYEHYYRQAAGVARRLGQEALGEQLTVPAKGRDAALRAAINTVNDRILERLNVEWIGRCGDAQKRFDRITDHGRKPVAAAEAKRQALAEEKARWAARAPPTRPLSGSATTPPR